MTLPYQKERDPTLPKGEGPYPTRRRGTLPGGERPYRTVPCHHIPQPLNFLPGRQTSCETQYWPFQTIWFLLPAGQLCPPPRIATWAGYFDSRRPGRGRMETRWSSGGHVEARWRPGGGKVETRWRSGGQVMGRWRPYGGPKARWRPGKDQVEVRRPGGGEGPYPTRRTGTLP